jgi:hypothetical protein
VAELLVKATLERPKDIKHRAAQRIARVEMGAEGERRVGGAFGSLDHHQQALFDWLTTVEPCVDHRCRCFNTTEGMEVLGGSPPTVFVGDTKAGGAARIDVEGK